MSERVTMPALGESVTEGTVTRWLKNIGDTVEVDEPLLEVSTDKVDTEIPSPVAGTLQEILVQEDDTVPVGADLAVIGEGAAAGGSGESGGGDEAQSDAAEGDEAEGGEAESQDASAPEPEQPEPEAPSTEQPVAEQTSEPEQSQAQARSAAVERWFGFGGSGGSGGASGGQTVTMPALGESVTEGTVTRWLKSEGDTVEVDEPLLEVSTDKVDTEIPSPAAGVLSKILVQEDEVVPVGGDLAVIGGESGGGSSGESSDESAEDAGAQPSAEQEAPEAPAAEAPAAEAPAELPPPASAEQEAPAQEKADEATEQASQPAAQAAPAAAAPSTATATAPSGSTSTTTSTSASNGGSDDGSCLRHAAGPQAGGAALRGPRRPDGHRHRRPDPEAGRARRGREGQGGGCGSGRSRPARGCRPGLERAGRSWRCCGSGLGQARHPREDDAAPQGHRHADGRVAPGVGAADHGGRGRPDQGRPPAGPRQERVRAAGGCQASYLPFLALAAVEALKAHPNVNASVDGEEIVYHGQENLAIAVDTEKGLLVPVVKNAGDLNIAGLARAIADLADRTRNNKIAPDDLAGGTFTITNTGSRGALFDTPIINQPQVAILGTGALVKRPVVVADEDGGETIAVRSMMYLALSYDHRIVDGADAARFLGAMKTRLEEGRFEASLGL